MRLRLWPRTLPFQLVVVVAVAVAISNIGVAYYYYKNSADQARHDVNQHMIDRAAAVAATISLVQPQARLVVMRTMSRFYWRFREVPRSTNHAPMTAEEQVQAQNLQDALPEGHPGKKGTIVYLHKSMKTIAPDLRPALAHDRNVPDDAIQTIIPISTTSAVSGVLVRPTPDWPGEIMVAAVVALLVTSIGAALIAKRMVRPLSELTHAASAMAEGSGRTHVVEEGPADVRDAAAAFNAMAEKVTRTMESQRHLLSAVGHDLRTPITAMRINLEFVTDEDLREGLRRNLDELQALTEQVLAAARGTGGETKRNVDISALVESLCADLDDMGKPVRWAGHAPAPISCRPNEIRRAVRNLVENAVAYGSKAEVQIVDTDEAYEILVDDEGPGIPENDHQRVFEPFVRLEGSRNLATGGTGLGLTLVRAIAEGHGGTITLENRPEGGLRACIRLPRIDTTPDKTHTKSI